MADICKDCGGRTFYGHACPEESKVSNSASAQGSAARFPMQGADSIPMWLAEEVYAKYAAKYGSDQSLKQIGKRGGFYKEEVIELLKQ